MSFYLVGKLTGIFISRVLVVAMIMATMYCCASMCSAFIFQLKYIATVHSYISRILVTVIFTYDNNRWLGKEISGMS